MREGRGYLNKRNLELIDGLSIIKQDNVDEIAHDQVL
jgi:hypothetical protein